MGDSEFVIPWITLAEGSAFVLFQVYGTIQTDGVVHTNGAVHEHDIVNVIALFASIVLFM